MDAKGRISFPSKFREKISDTFYVTKGLDNCLFVYPESEWHIFKDKLKSLPITNKGTRTFVRTFFSGTLETSFDKQGRVMISANLREYANLNKNVTIIGVGARLEIWDTDAWIKYIEDDSTSLENNAASLEELGI